MQDTSELQDNRIRLVIDAKRIEAWEVILLEDNKSGVSGLLMMLSRYVANGSGPLSPEIPNKPLDSLTPEEIAAVKASKAYKALMRFPLPEIKKAAFLFGQEARRGLDPN